MQSLSELGSALQTHLSSFLWLYRDYVAMYNNNKLRYKHTSHVFAEKISPSLPVITFLPSSSSPNWGPKITSPLTLFNIVFPVKLYLGFLWFMALFLWYTVDGVGCRGGTQRVGWDGFQRSAWWFSAKVNKELSYHTICCLWSVTHGFWPAASTLPACLFTCLTDQCGTLNNSSCHMSKYIQREEADCIMCVW